MKLELMTRLVASLTLLLVGCQKRVLPEDVQQETTPHETEQNAVVDVEPVESASVEGSVEMPGGPQLRSDSVQGPASKVSWPAGLLTPGSTAPAIDLAAVVHGPEVRLFTGEQVVVVEFWATWCETCIESMPHISGLQLQYGPEVQFIGVTSEAEDVVTRFLAREVGEGESQADQLSYTIALDYNARTSINFMDAARRRRVPCAFVINKAGKVAWIGPPSGIENPLAEIVGGTWDIENARREFLRVVGIPVNPGRSQPALPTLAPGMPAPPVQLAAVVHGEPFDGRFLRGKTYVVEFWATYCGPCLASIPHINKQQDVGRSTVQCLGVTAESRQTVRDFLGRDAPGDRKWSENLKYTIALDDALKTFTSYMDAAGQERIPCAFIVNQSGQLAWVGHPAEIDKPLKSVLNGTCDIEANAVLFHTKLNLRAAIDQRNFDRVLELLSDLSANQLNRLQFQDMQLRLLSQLRRWPRYNELAADVVAQMRTDFMEPLIPVKIETRHWSLLNTIAWEIAAVQTGNRRDLDLAREAALMAGELSGNHSAAVLDTVARVYYEQGDIRQAVNWQKKALGMVRFMPRRQRTQQFGRTLELYESMLSRMSPRPEYDADTESKSVDQ